MNTTRFSRTRASTAAAAILLLCALGCSKEQGAGGGAEVGSTAPAYALPDLDGKTVRNSDFLGRVVILDFWATWCPPCRVEVPHFVRLQSKYREQGLAIVGLSLDQGGAKDVRPFADEFDVNYTMLIANDKTADDYGGIVGIPTTFVIDRDGKVVKRFVGYTAPEVFEETIRPLLASTS